jgi:hypothetical protein
VADDPSVQLVSQAQLAYARRALPAPARGLPLLSAAAPFKTGGRQGWGYYTDIPAGPVAVRNVADLYIYPNTVKAVKLTGAQVREWLEMSAGPSTASTPPGRPSRTCSTRPSRATTSTRIDGVSYRIDVTQPARYDRSGKLVAPEARRIVDLRHEGRPIDDDRPSSSSSPTTTAPPAAAPSRGWTAATSCSTRPTRTARRWCSTCARSSTVDPGGRRQLAHPAGAGREAALRIGTMSSTLGRRRHRPPGALPAEPAVPMLFFYGERKPFQFQSQAWLDRLAARPHSRVVPLPTGHWVMVQRPQVFNDTVRSWLAETDEVVA